MIPRHDMPAAEADFTEALRRHPQDIAALMNRGVARGNQDNLAGAIADWTEVIRLNPRVIQAHVLRATAKRQAGDLDGALADLESCLRLLPPHARREREQLEGLITQFRGEP